MVTIRRGGIVLAQTTVAIPETLRDWARKNKISLSGTLTEALTTKVEHEIRARAHVAKQSAQAVNSPYPLKENLT